MLYQATISRSALELLNRIMSDEVMINFVLAGGTALTLQLGHRISLDIDLFTDKAFSESNLADHLRASYQFELDFISKNTLKGEINGIKIDCIAHQYPWVDNYKCEGNIRLAGFTDIAAMKLNAIAGNGTRLKDYIDIAFLSGRISFIKMLEGYELKYKSNPVMPLKAITYYADINFNEPVKMTGDISFDWKSIEKRLKNMVNEPDRIFDETDFN